MSVRASKSVVGGFIVGAVVLAVAAVLLFGGQRLFAKGTKAILFFEGSVAGLSTGAPVLLNGVRIGDVKVISLRFDPKDLSFDTLVIVEIYGRVEVVGGESVREEALKRFEGDQDLVRRDLIRKLIGHGLRGQLGLQSMVTGQLMIELGFWPNSEVKLVGGGDLVEIPTIPSDMERLKDTLQDLPIKDVFDNLDKSLTHIAEIISSKDLTEGVAALSEGARNLSDLLAKWEERSDGLIERMEGVLDEARGLTRKVGDQVGPLAEDARETLRKGTAAIEQAASTLAAIEEEVGPDASVVRDLREALASFARAMDSVRALADTIDRHPEALLQGKGGS